MCHILIALFNASSYSPLVGHECSHPVQSAIPSLPESLTDLRTRPCHDFTVISIANPGTCSRLALTSRDDRNTERANAAAFVSCSSLLSCMSPFMISMPFTISDHKPDSRFTKLSFSAETCLVTVPSAASSGPMFSAQFSLLHYQVSFRMASNIPATPHAASTTPTFPNAANVPLFNPICLSTSSVPNPPSSLKTNALLNPLTSIHCLPSNPFLPASLVSCSTASAILLLAVSIAMAGFEAGEG